jgi:hypothetical protein
LWTEEDTAAYWAEVAAEEAADLRRLYRRHGGLDPLGPRVQFLVARASPPPCLAEGDEEGEGWGDLWERCMGLLPHEDVEVLRAVCAATDGWSLGAKRARGAAGAEVSQAGWWLKVARVRARLAVVAPYAGMEGGEWTWARVVGDSRFPELVGAFLGTWRTTSAARACGLSQSTAYGRLAREPNPVVQAVLRRPPDDARPRPRSGR